MSQIKKVCCFCGNVYFVHHSRDKISKFCSKSCLAKNRKGYKYSEETIVKFRRSPLWNNIEKIKILYQEGLTSKEIAEKYNVPTETVKSIFRKINFTMRKSAPRKGRIPWNQGKAYHAIRGRKNHNWKGGITSLPQQIRHCIEYKNWKKAIFKRDNQTCTICSEKGVQLETDHYPIKFCDIISNYKITSYKEAQDCLHLWDLDNGRTLCLNCHNKTKIKNS